MRPVSRTKKLDPTNRMSSRVQKMTPRLSLPAVTKGARGKLKLVLPMMSLHFIPTKHFSDDAQNTEGFLGFAGQANPPKRTVPDIILESCECTSIIMSTA